MARAEAEFARDYEEHVWRVYAFLAYRVGHRQTAEDLTQLTFERALRAWSRFDPRGGSESAWLLTIARNALIDHTRRDRSALIHPLDERQLPAMGGPEERFAGSAELVEALARLSDRDREVIALRFGGQLADPDIAAQMGLTVANVQQIVSRSLRKLRVWLEEGREAAPSE